MNKVLLYITIFLLSLVVGGCAGRAKPVSPSLGQEPDGGAATQTLAPSPATAASPQGAAGAGPQEQAMYDVLLGEIAGRRGVMDVSVASYLDAARLTRDPQVAERAVQIALIGGDIQAGLEAARLLAELKPGDTEAQQFIALLTLRSGQPQQALAPLEQVAMGNPGGPGNGFLVVAALLSREQDKVQSMELMRTLVQRHPTVPEAWLALATLAIRAGQSEAALQAVDRGLALRPHWSEAITLRASLLQAQGKGKEAVAYMQGVVQAYPKDTGLRLQYARLLLGMDDFDRARTQFEALARLQPDNADVVLTLGILYLQAEQPARAKAQFKRVLASGERKLEANYYLGQVAEVEKRDQQAIAYYRAVTSGANYINAQIRVAAILADQGKLRQALRHLDGVHTATAEQRVRVLLVQAELLRDAGRHDAALSLYGKGLAEFPGNEDLLYARAMLAERMDRLDLLERDLRAILAADPDNVQALNALGYTLADRTNRYEEALHYLKKAIALKPNDFYILDSMGWLQYRMGNKEAALGYLKKAMAVKPDPEVAAHLGEVLWSLGQKKEAQAAWRQGLELDPKSKIIRATMQRLRNPAPTATGVADEK